MDIEIMHKSIDFTRWSVVETVNNRLSAWRSEPQGCVLLVQTAAGVRWC